MIDKFIQKEVQNLIDEYHERCKEDNKLIYKSCLKQLRQVIFPVFITLLSDTIDSCGCYERSCKYIFYRTVNKKINEIRLDDDLYYRDQGKNVPHTPNCVMNAFLKLSRKIDKIWKH